MEQRITAIAIAAVMVAAGLSVAPPAMAGHQTCHEDFVIAEDKSNADVRDLATNVEEVGQADVSAGTPEDLMVDLRTSDAELSIEVFEQTATGCVEFNESGCDRTITSTGDQEVCTLEDPVSGSTDYFVHYENVGNVDLEYLTWTPDA